ncbi:energy transducer TonB [Sphingomonas sp. BN140010]|uniref:Energy transducer TonB n=1 Tax=Sphingomonas arvum TaxID=2992113 RepID=A0ABT3JFQ6_9SPHN|nr:energy transducer TonB [Sphingomonas sp. BN140010]MCW3797904.1 energy transducer TonB [Sphingomonas sp. BN140010]
MMVAAFSLLGSTVSAAPKESIRLAPLSPWNLHYGDNSCRLGRLFGSAAKPTSLVLERISPGGSMSLLVFGGDLKAREGEAGGSVQLLPVPGREFDTGGVTQTAETEEPAILWPHIELLAPHRKSRQELREEYQQAEHEQPKAAAIRAEEDANAKLITSFAIREPSGRTLILETGSLGRANALMRDCARQQLLAWGIDPAVQEKIVKPARTKNLPGLFSSSDYPPGAAARGEQSIVEARLNIDAEGRVRKCTSLTYFKAPEFAEVVCRRLSKARYTPAELADGTKVPTYDLATIKFLRP